MRVVDAVRWGDEHRRPGRGRRSSDATLGERVVATARERHGRLDGVVNAAGVVAFGPIVETDDAVLEELFLTNVLGPLWLTRRVAPALADSRGFLVQLSAVVAEQPLPGMAGYAASKAALTGARTRPLAGVAPRLPVGLDPDEVARPILDAIEEGRSELASTDFG